VPTCRVKLIRLAVNVAHDGQQQIRVVCTVQTADIYHTYTQAMLDQRRDKDIGTLSIEY
jgi:hypothetical protein